MVQATHLCMAMRGIKKLGAITTTSKLTGLFLDDHALRAEFMGIATQSNPHSMI